MKLSLILLITVLILFLAFPSKNSAKQDTIKKEIQRIKAWRYPCDGRIKFSLGGKGELFFDSCVGVRKRNKIGNVENLCL